MIQIKSHLITTDFIWIGWFAPPLYCGGVGQFVQIILVWCLTIMEMKAGTKMILNFIWKCSSRTVIERVCADNSILLFAPICRVTITCNFNVDWKLSKHRKKTQHFRFPILTKKFTVGECLNYFLLLLLFHLFGISCRFSETCGFSNRKTCYHW